MHSPCQLVALGIINALSSEHSQIAEGLLEGDSAGISLCDDLPNGPVLTASVSDLQLLPVPDEFRRYNSRLSQLLIAAYQQISAEVEAIKGEMDAARIGVVLGTSTSGIASGETAIAHYAATGKFPADFFFSQQEMGTPAEFLAEYAGFGGPAITVSTACSSSAKAFGVARDLITANVCDAIIVGGADSLCKLTLAGFSSLEATTASQCNPMSKNRDGISIGEGAALFLMMAKPKGVQLLGIGESSDAFHMTHPDPDGHSAEIAIRTALDQDDRHPDQIGYINLHGTATVQNDAMEAGVVSRVFGSRVPCSSTKPLTGHTLGACGAIEIGFCWLLLTGGAIDRLPPHCWDGCPDETLPELQFVDQSKRYVLPDPPAMISNSFAFGGSNCAVVIGYHE